jgi:hypothetical protein
MAILHKDLKEFLRLLGAHKVRYLVVGGYAVGVHGYPRYTGDLDVFVDSAPDNAASIVAAFREFGFDLPVSMYWSLKSLSGLDACAGDCSVKMGHPLSLFSLRGLLVNI